MATEKYSPLKQSGATLGSSALGMDAGTQAAAAAARPPAGATLAVTNAMGAAAQAASKAPPGTCQQSLTLTFFFDGTGNNIDADVGTMQHSNVARLFQSRMRDDPAEGRYSFYSYGIGTYFREIDDPGNTDAGLGFGNGGQARINWAFRKFDEVLNGAQCRAQNPTNPIVVIRVAVFGFSRGATQARAFCRQLQERCHLRDGRYQLKAGGAPVELYFLGLFDTVASVGAPMSANNTSGATTAGLYSLSTTLSLRASSSESGIRLTAFGQPGADPAPGPNNGHLGYGDGLAIVAMVQRGLHLVAGHEIRNSFPLDSTLAGDRYPPGMNEMVYPGAHSDVGGGYQPGEGGRSPHPGELLSLVPLLVMHAEAVKCGVPLYPLNSLPKRYLEDFALDPASQAKYSEMLDHWKHYMTVAVPTGNLGQQFLAHMRQYYRWRFRAIARARQASTEKRDSAESQNISRGEVQFAKQRQAQAKVVAERKAELDAATRRANAASERYMAASGLTTRTGIPINPAVAAARQEAEQSIEPARDAYLREKAQLDTLADDSALLNRLSAYDERLMADAKLLADVLKHAPNALLRPHYRNLFEAYQDEFVLGRGLRDEKLIAFFDRYVHDSLASFAKDATLPSDPRVLYVGGNTKSRYAEMKHPETRVMTA